MKISHSVRLVLATAAIVTGAGLVPSAQATQPTAALTVQVTVPTNCTITAATLTFTSYDPIVANATADQNNSTTMNIVCTNGSAVKVIMDQGLYPYAGVGGVGASTVAAPVRQMEVAGGTTLLSYNLYKDSAWTTVWGGDDAHGFSYTGTGVSGTNLTVYGKIPAGQTGAIAGNYADTVNATVDF